MATQNVAQLIRMAAGRSTTSWSCEASLTLSRSESVERSKLPWVLSTPFGISVVLVEVVDAIAWLCNIIINGNLYMHREFEFLFDLFSISNYLLFK